MFMVYSGDDVMTKSIEEQREELAEKYVSLSAPEMTRLQMSWDFKNGFDAGAKARDAEWFKVVNEFREALKHTNEFCLCKRNTYGFDYHEDHPVMGKPKGGARWLTPRDYIKNSLTKADQMLKKMNINKGE